MTTHTNQHQTSAVAREVRSIAKKLGLLLALFAVLVSALITMGSTAGGAVAGASSRSWGWAQWDHFGWVLLGIFASLALWGIIAFLRGRNPKPTS